MDWILLAMTLFEATAFSMLAFYNGFDFVPLILAVSMPLLLIALVSIMPASMPLFTRMQTSVDNVNRTVQENLTNVRVVKSFVREEKEKKKFARVSGELLDTALKAMNLVIIISQSGETLDTMAALREAKKRGAYILSIVNVVGSSIARESDDVLYTWAGPEIAVATTKAYSTQLAVLDMVGLCFAKILGTVREEEYADAVRELALLPDKVKETLGHCEDIQKYAAQHFHHESVFFIGRNLDYALGLEGSLKLKEISYIHSEAYASGELKHGTISLIEDGTLVIALGTYGPLFDKAMSNVVEVKARGADVLALTTESHRGEMAKTVDHVLTIPDTAAMLLPSLGVVPLQLFSYYIALQRGCDIDKPRNLAKSVTVE